jgi:hypothetical protein
MVPKHPVNEKSENFLILPLINSLIFGRKAKLRITRVPVVNKSGPIDNNNKK